jgi:hypothetical protein
MSSINFLMKNYNSSCFVFDDKYNTEQPSKSSYIFVNIKLKPEIDTMSQRGSI